MNSCLQKFFEGDLCRSNSVLPFSFLHKGKLFRAGKLSFLHRQWHLETLAFQKIPIWQHIIIQHIKYGKIKLSSCQL